jgi:hypothetical protein
MQDITDTYLHLQREHFDIENLTAKLEQKKHEPTWSINSCDPTPEVFYEPQPDSDLDYWKSTALRYGNALQTLDKVTDYRKSIRATLYWKTEAEYMRKEFWAVNGRRQRRINNTKRDQLGTKKGTQSGLLKSKQTAPAQSKEERPVENNEGRSIEEDRSIKEDFLIEKEGQGPISSRLRNREPTASHSFHRGRIGTSRSGSKVETQKYPKTRGRKGKNRMIC